MDRYLIMLFGNIASGKSTMAKRLNKAGCVCVSSDGIRYMFNPAEYKFDANLEYAVHEVEVTSVTKLMELGRNIVVDDAGNCLKRRRSWLISLAKENGYKLISVNMPFVSKRASVMRRLKDNHGKYDKKRWEEVYDMFQKNYSPATIKEGFHGLFAHNSSHLFDLFKKH